MSACRDPVNQSVYKNTAWSTYVKVYQAPPPHKEVKLEDLRWWKSMNESEI